MVEIKFERDKGLRDASLGEDDYYLVTTNGGSMTCSCGRELVKVDEVTWRCAGGYPEWRLDQSDVIYDKFGNIYLKGRPHSGEVKDETDCEGRKEIQKERSKANELKNNMKR